MSSSDTGCKAYSRPLPSWTKDVDVASDDGSSSSEPSQEEEEHVDAKIAESLISNPLDAAERWRTLYHQRIRCGTNQELWEFTRAIGSVAESGISGAKNKGAKLVQLSFRCLLSQFGLCTFLQDIVNEDDFFDEHPDFVIIVLEIIFSIVAESKRRRVGTLEPLRSLIATLCESSWNNQKLLLDDPTIDHFYPNCRYEVRSQLYHIMLALIMPSAKPYGSDHAIRRMSLLCWFHSPERETNKDDLNLSVVLLDHAIRGCLSDSDDEDTHTPSVSSTIMDLMGSDIVPALGAKPYLKRLLKTLEHPELAKNSLNWAVMSACRSIVHPDLMARLASSGVLAALVENVRHQAMQGEPAMVSVPLANLLGLYTMIMNIGAGVPGVQSAIPGLIRQGCLVEMMTLALRVCVTQGQSRSLNYGLCQDCLEATRSRVVTINRLSANNTLRKTMRQGFREHWYSTLAFLRQTRSSSASGSKHNKVLETWQCLGEDLGFEETKQKEEYERELRKNLRRCSRKDCPYHDNEPPVSLRACKGCADVRYCSVSCQRSDWKGGHKLRCRRLDDWVPTDAT